MNDQQRLRRRAAVLAFAAAGVAVAPLTGCGAVPYTRPPAISASGQPGSGPFSGPSVGPRPTQAATRPAQRPSVTSVPAAPPSNPSTVPIATPSPLPRDASKYLPAAPAGSRGVVYLTFDDGPSPYTPRILQILTHTSSTATFFELGINQQTYPTTAKTVHTQGSAVGNHTYDHHDLTTLTNTQVRSELRRGPKRATCARPPYGATNTRVRHLIEAGGMRQIQWSDDSIDWSRPGQHAIYLRATSEHVVNGSIVLMHDGGGNRDQTVAALPKIIDELHRRGYLIRRLPGC